MIIHGDRILLVAAEQVPVLAPEEAPFRVEAGGEREAGRLVREGLARPLVVDVLVATDVPDRLEVRLVGLRLALDGLLPRLAGAPEAGAFVIGYRTAAWLLASGPAPDEVDVVVAPNTARVRRRPVHTHEHRLDRADVLRLGGLWVTTPARTAADLARQRPGEAGSDDEALAATLDRLRDTVGLSGATVLSQLDRMAHARGVARARQRVLRWALEPTRQSPRFPVTR